MIFEMPDLPEPAPWILTEEEPLYRLAFPPGCARSSGRNEAVLALADEPSEEAGDTIVLHYLRTCALVALTELTNRYPIPAAFATERLERWAEDGKVIRVGQNGSDSGDRWADRENLGEMLRVSVAVRRRESLAVQPEVFADFLLRFQHVHPATRGAGATFVDQVIDQLQGHPAAGFFVGNRYFSRRVKDYRSDWLDDALDRGHWLWRFRRRWQRPARGVLSP